MALDAESIYQQSLCFLILAAVFLVICGYLHKIMETNEFYLYYKALAKNKDQRYEVDMRAR